MLDQIWFCKAKIRLILQKTQPERIRPTVTIRICCIKPQ